MMNVGVPIRFGITPHAAQENLYAAPKAPLTSPEAPPAKAVSKTRRWVKRGVLVAVMSVAGFLGRDLARPSVWRALNNNLQYTQTAEATARDKQIAQHIRDTYVNKGDGKIDWYEFADLVDYIANHTESDEEFRRALWDGVINRFHKNLDADNTGLPAYLHNRDSNGNLIERAEQMHHYLGGTTGKTGSVPSHLLNNEAGMVAHEMHDFLDDGHWNSGDMALFRVARQHRDVFLTQGRHAVAPLIRSMLVPQK